MSLLSFELGPLHWFHMFLRAQALFNAVKKQYKLHSYLLQLALPDPSPDPVPIPIPLPQLPPPSLTMSPAMNASPRQKSNDLALDGPNSIRMNEADIKNTAQFVREFLLMSLLPWMERQVVEWNENVMVNPAETVVCAHRVL